eukprot:CAMPEP_0173408408 /NCGR_PEP_ID=MMETSP1356-20130122/69660_1 /TAXON_ID=77927 ORGANISM="Hemiselmis virescens, Strain PCC157" /NCGR_SAMPLE_ID=MMETSP1356 /ASSEMBLY_ACC=CAM_ASM_000847 /LENGTH=99 /DNA_ID=CAMNT_0014369715 /DNA_START=511 /DNA_END=807 /DNA_ORIENTATION=+
MRCSPQFFATLLVVSPKRGVLLHPEKSHSARRFTPILLDLPEQRAAESALETDERLEMRGAESGRGTEEDMELAEMRGAESAGGAEELAEGRAAESAGG